MIGAAADIITGFVRDRILIPLTKFVIRWLVREVGRSSDERAGGEPVWLLAAGVTYAGWALLFGTISVALMEDLLIALGWASRS